MTDSTLHAAQDNPFPPDDDAPLGLTADGARRHLQHILGVNTDA